METLMIGSSGPNVMLIQSLLSKIGYNPGPIDGAFGQQTQAAVVAFQRNNGLVADGIVGAATWSIFDTLLRGYDTYTILSGDTLYNIAIRFHTSVNAILTANPDIDPNFLQVGQQIIVPYGIDLVFTDIDYTYDIMERQIQGLKVRYPFLEVGTIGKSVMGKELYYIRLGNGNNHVSYNASHHANEWITTPILMKFIENFAKAYSVKGNIRGYNINDIFNYASIYLIPMVNPDGVDLVTYWPNYTNLAYKQASELNKTGLPLPSVWKANIRGVDLNLNYPAEWERAKEIQIEEGFTVPAPRNFGGDSPLSEPESIAMVDFTKQKDFRLVIAYHTQGEVIYYQFENFAPPESTEIAQQFAHVSGYQPIAIAEEAAYAGYKDWFLQEYQRPGFTVEAGQGVNPLAISQFPKIYDDNEEILLLGALV